MIEIRDAIVADIPQLIQIIEATHHEKIDEVRLIKRVSTPNQSENHRLIVAHNHNVIIGFVDGFMTMDARKHCRWELDLLGVLPEFQNKGIGRLLIQQFLVAGESHARLTICRALVAIDNVPMQRTMQRTGFETNKKIYSLMVAEPHQLNKNSVEDCHLIPVETCLYDGIWLEGDINPACIASAHNLANEKNYDILGTLVALNDVSSTSILRDQQFDEVGQFNWWEYRYV